MPEENRVVHDAVHGSVTFSREFQPFLDTAEMQRAGRIKQLGLANLVFPGANHTRLEHMIGAFHLASRFCDVLGIRDADRKLILVSALLHDIGHLPFSHTFEEVVRERLGMSHMDITASVIRSEMDIIPEQDRQQLQGTKSIKECIETLSLEPRQVAEIVRSEKGMRGVAGYVTSLIHGPVDVDQMDYLMRDSHYTGVAPGRVDADRIIQTSEIMGGRMLVRRAGIPAVEGLIVSRILMNTAVYFHKTVRIAELMLTRAVETLDDEALSDTVKDTDDVLMCRLMQKGGYAAEIALRLRYRRLFKPAFIAAPSELTEDERSALAETVRRNGIAELEEELCERAHLPPGHVLIDTASPEYIEGREVPGKTDVPILDDNGRVVSLARLSSIAAAMRRHPRQEYLLLVACEEKGRNAIRRLARRLIF